jgi:hypothetical protein
MMRLSRYGIVLLLLLLSLSSLASASEVITAEELLDGEMGYGLTVLKGDSITRFNVRYLGRLENAMPGQDMVLIRLTDESFERSGVIAGMSGSPIYFRGRLLGALAYGWLFAREPIAGVTTIGSMLTLPAQMASSPSDSRLRPLSTPLSVAGVPRSGHDETWRRIDALGFSAAPGGRASGRGRPLEPGSAVGVRLIDGDLSMDAIGTVTWVSDSVVLAFGHPFINRGRLNLPMTGARIEAILPAVNRSFKLGTGTDAIGAILRDAEPGIAGEIGAVAEMIPMTVRLKAPWGERRFSYRIAKDEIISPALFDIAWAQSAEAGLFAVGRAGVDIALTVFSGRRTVSLRDRIVIAGQLLDVMPTLPIRMLYQNPFARFHPDRVEIEVTVDDDLREYEILSARPLASILRPGEFLPVEVTFRVFGEGRQTRTVEIEIPPVTPDGTYLVQVRGGRGGNPPGAVTPRDLDGMLDRLAGYESRDRLVVTLSRPEGRQAEIEQGTLPLLPGSQRALQNVADRGALGVTTVTPMPGPISGAARLQIEVKR